MTNRIKSDGRLAAENRIAEAELETSGFFVLRAPLWPIDEWLDLGEQLESPAALAADDDVLTAAIDADYSRLRARFESIVARPEFREAVYVASPVLANQIDRWLADPECKRSRKILRSLFRYFCRMTCRSTPFGLFAGCAKGTLGERTRLALDAPERCRRETRLDMEFVSSLVEALTNDPLIRSELEFRPNSSLYRIGDRIRYVESRIAANVRSHHLVALDWTQYLGDTLARAGAGATRSDLANALVAADPEIAIEDALNYIDELIEAQALTSDLEPAVTGDDPVGAIANRMSNLTTGATAASILNDAGAKLDGLDAAGVGNGPERYRTVRERLETLPVEIDESRLFQVDLVRSVREATLGPALVDDLRSAVQILHRIAAPTSREADVFVDRFRERYEDQEVPLVEVLDDELGISTRAESSAGTDPAPLLNGIDLPTRAGGASDTWGARDDHLLERLVECRRRGELELRLEPADLEALRVDDPLPLPDAFSVFATAVGSPEDVEKGEHELLVHGVAGPSGARMLGRFCHASPELAEAVADHLRAEEALRPDAVFAEVVHLPEGRTGNILRRPVLRDHEIPFLGVSGTDRERQIPVTDLTLSLDGNDIVLRSRSLDKVVIPRLTTAHSFATSSSLEIYKFLCSLQTEGVAHALAWDWGPLARQSFLPRIRVGRLVLSRARWRVDRATIERLADGSPAQAYRNVRAWRSRHDVPRRVVLAENDNELPLDLDDPVAVETFLQLARKRETSLLLELLPDPDGLCALGDGGRFAHELVVPLHRRRSNPAGRSSARATSTPIVRRFAPGSEWLYLKLYTGTASADRILVDSILPAVREWRRAGLIDGWHFVRYWDPDYHLRLRMHGDPEALARHVRSALHATIAPLLANGLVSRVQLDTYVREVERYGGHDGIELCESIFDVDSSAVCAALEQLAETSDPDARWRLALHNMSILLDDFGFSLDDRARVAGESRSLFTAEFGGDGLRHTLNGRYRSLRGEVRSILTRAAHVESPLAPAVIPLRERSAELRPVVAALGVAARRGLLHVPLSDLALSVIHMSTNRLLRSAHRAHELVLWTLLDRHYASELARTRSRTGSSPTGDDAVP